MRKDAAPLIRVGLPEVNGYLPRVAEDMHAPVMVSAGRLFRDGRFRSFGMLPWRINAAIDSSGFTAMFHHGGYRWSVWEYVEWMVMNAHGPHCDLPWPWAFWSAMDYCCEQEIATNRSEVDRRVALTIESFRETLEALDY